MAKIDSLSHVGVFVRDQKKAKEFYTKKLGLKVRSLIPKMGYLALGATKGGEDASLNLWQPTREMWGPEYDDAVKQIGVVTGIGFRTTNLEKTIADLKRRQVKVEGPGQEGEGRLASIYDPDGNVVFAYEPAKPKVRRAGLLSLDFVTIASRDASRAGEFFTKALG
ncbi:MAG: VOC family protein, partial [Candidatus Thermoplasmatota archaeon]